MAGRDTMTDRLTSVEATCAVRHVNLDEMLGDHETRIRCLEQYHVKMVAYTSVAAAVGAGLTPLVLKYVGF